VERFKVNLAKGERLLDRMLGSGIALEHECGGMLACASCCIIVHEGAQTLSPASDDERDMLERAEADEPGSRLACQALADGGDVVVEVSARRIPARAAGSCPASPAGAKACAGRAFRELPGIPSPVPRVLRRISPLAGSPQAQ
jgi:2Fe-2S ferredoxin